MVMRVMAMAAMLLAAMAAIAPADDHAPPGASATIPEAALAGAAPAPDGSAAPETAPPAAAKTENEDAGGTGALSEAAVLTPEEKAEKEARKACKIEICNAFRKPAAAGREDITCDVMKSWRKQQLVKMVARLKVTWPYGPVRCSSALKLKRSDLFKAVIEEKHQSQLDKHSVSCQVERENEAATKIKLEFSPKISFEKGKAVAAKMNWGRIEAPALIKGALWTATAADNTVNMLSGSLVEDINDFVVKKCDEVKEEAAATVK